MAQQIIEVATVFAGIVENRRYEAGHVAEACRGDWLSLVFTDGRDEHGPVLGVVFTPNAVVVRRPASEESR